MLDQPSTAKNKANPSGAARQVAAPTKTSVLGKQKHDINNNSNTSTNTKSNNNTGSNADSNINKGGKEGIHKDTLDQDAGKPIADNTNDMVKPDLDCDLEKVEAADALFMMSTGESVNVAAAVIMNQKHKAEKEATVSEATL